MESKINGTYQELVGRKHAFTYDEQGNRKTHSRNSHTTTYTTNNLNQYTARTYTWGPDVSGSFGGVGGNGGVLIFKDHTSTVNESFFPAYDAQGNVTGLIDTSGNLDAAYEYASASSSAMRARAGPACRCCMGPSTRIWKPA